MNKRAQLYLLAAILVCLGIYGAIKINNKLVAPSDTEFSFYVDNFKGERTQVINLGYIKTGSGDIESITSDGKNMLDIFTELGWHTGIIFIQPISGGHKIINYLDSPIEFCSGSECQIISGGGETAGELNFEFGTGRKIKVADKSLNEIEDATGQKFTYQTSEPLPFTIKIDQNIYSINKDYQTIIFKDIDENFKKVEVV